MKNSTKGIIAVLGSVAVSASLLATMDVQSQFKKAFPDNKEPVKCSNCHVKPLPKKDDHENNDYGKKVAANPQKDAKGVVVKDDKGATQYDWKAIGLPKAK